MKESNTESRMFQSSTTDDESSFATPMQKLGLQEATSAGDMFDTALNSGGASSDLSLKEGSAFSSSLTTSSDSELESDFYVKRNVIQKANTDNAGVQQMITEFNTKAMDEDSLLDKMKDVIYRDLLEKVSYYERELELANRALQASQEEISRQKHELAQSATVTGVSKNLHDEFDTTCVDANELQDHDMKVLQLQNKIERLELSVQDSHKSNTMLMHELNETKERLQNSEKAVLEFEHKLKTEVDEVTNEMQNQIKAANVSVRALEVELASERRVVSELHARIDTSANDLTNRNQEIQVLNLALRDAHENFSNERSRFVFDISVLSEKQKALEGKLDQAELREKFLEDQIAQCELEKREIRGSLEAQEKLFLAEINQLKTELTQRSEQVDMLNKRLDASMFKYDMLMAEKDGVTAKVDTLVAQAHCKDIQIQQMETHLIELKAEGSKLLAGLENEQRIAGELRLRVAELEKEVDMQRTVILDRAEEKREAIRQLCFSLEYYRSEYHELGRAFVRQKRQPV